MCLLVTLCLDNLNDNSINQSIEKITLFGKVKKMNSIFFQSPVREARML